MKKRILPLSLLFIILFHSGIAQQPIRSITETGKNEDGQWKVSKKWNEDGELIAYDSSFVSNQSMENPSLHPDPNLESKFRRFDYKFEDFFNQSFGFSDSTSNKFNWEEFHRQFEFPELDKTMTEIENWLKSLPKKSQLKKEESQDEYLIDG